MDLGFYTVNTDLILAYLAAFFSQPTWTVIFELVALGGWLILYYLLFYVGLHLYQEYRQEKNTHHWKWILLAIDIPPINVQTPKAVEQMFAQIAGAYDAPNIAQKFHHGYKQRWFSFEIISIEGYIQFLVRTEEKFRDLIEASVYAQYPDAEITEVEDYVKSVPDSFPNKDYDIWATEFALTQHEGIPLRLYREFEHSISKDTVLKDPMGTFLESFSRIGPGEQMWFQMVAEPTGSSWKEHVIEKIKELIGDTSLHAHHGEKNVIDKTIDSGFLLFERFGDVVLGREWGEASAHEEKKEEPNKLKYLTPGQVKLVESMEEKINKIGYKVKIRGVYFARKEVFNPARGANALVGAINQYNMPNANCLAPAYGVSAHYLFAEQRKAYRKTALMKAFKKRKLKFGKNPYVLNIEELATLWHFPMSHVKTPLVQKAEGKRAEPPSSLPIESVLAPEVVKEKKQEVKRPVGYTTDSGAVFDDNGVKFG